MHEVAAKTVIFGIFNFIYLINLTWWTNSDSDSAYKGTSFAQTCLKNLYRAALRYRAQHDRDTWPRYRRQYSISRVKNEEARRGSRSPRPTDSSGCADAVDAEALRRTACGFLLVYRLFFAWPGVARPNAPQYTRAIFNCRPFLARINWMPRYSNWRRESDLRRVSRQSASPGAGTAEAAQNSSGIITIWVDGT